MISPKEALQLILKNAKKPTVKTVNLSNALDYVPAKEVKAKINVPPFDNSAMDGFAVHADDLGSTKPLELIGEVQAGQFSKLILKKGQAISIMTGAPIPKGTGAVVPIERVEVRGQRVEVSGAIAKGANIRKAGEDIQKGSTVIKEGTLLKPIYLGLAASIGVDELSLYEKPKVAVVVTGDEIIKPGKKLTLGQIYESNSFLLTGLLTKTGADLVSNTKAKDTLSSTKAVLAKALEKADIVLTTGGISVGKYDLIAKALLQMGAKQLFSKVAQKPGKPLSLFRYQKPDTRYRKLASKIIISLPGNPVAVGVCFEVYVRPLLLKIAGHSQIFRPQIKAQLIKPIKKKKGRTSYIRVRLEKKENQYFVATTGSQGSGVLSSLQADGLVVLPSETENLKAGSKVDVICLEGNYR